MIATWFDHLTHHPQLPKLALFSYCPLEGPLARALDAAVAGGHGRSASFGRHARALLAPDGAREDYLDRAVGRKKRKELRRQRNRLADGGVVMSSSVAEPSARVRSTTSWRSKPADGRAAPEPPPAPMTTSASSWPRPSPGSPAQGARRPAARRRAADRRRGDAQERRHRVGVEDRLRRDLCALLAGLSALARRHRGSARRSRHRARRFLRHARSSDDRSHLARASRARRPPDTDRAGWFRRLRGRLRAQPRCARRSRAPRRRAACCGANAKRPHARCRSNRRITLPVVVIGICSMKATSRGYSCADRRLDESLDLGGERVGRRRARLEHDEGLHDLGAHRIGLADDGGERDRRMADQAILDLAGPMR